MHSVIFINSPEKNVKSTTTLQQLFFVTPNDLFLRIFASFVPPLSKKYQKVYVDFQGPLLGLLLLVALLIYGNSNKNYQIAISPAETLIYFSIFMPVFCFALSKVAKSTMTMYEMVSLIGYSLFGHLFTLLVSLICFQETSNFFFFVCLIFFGGLSTLRLILVVLFTISIPALRLVICSVISVVNLLFLLFLHFAYMHKTYNNY